MYLFSFVQGYVLSLRGHGGVINRTIALSAAKGIVEFHDATLLVENGGHINLTQKWAESLLTRMNMVR